jgi:hypothetical protein
MTLPDSMIGDRSNHRYEISALDDGHRFVVGWSDDPEAFEEAIRLHPSWNDRQVKDRKPGTTTLTSEVEHGDILENEKRDS